MKYKDDDMYVYAQDLVLETKDEHQAAAVYVTLSNFGSFLSPGKMKAEAEVIKQRAKRHGHTSPCFIMKKDGQKFKWTCGEVE